MPTTAIRRVLATLAATAVAIPTIGVGSAAADDFSEQAPKARLVLTATETPWATPIGGEVQPQVTRVTLTCGPDGGSHPDPAGACDSLRAVGGYFERLPSAPGACPAVWAPVTVTATGTWGEREVAYKETFGNSCEADLGTDGVFSF